MSLWETYVEKVLKTTDPTASDTAYPILCLWGNTVLDTLWVHWGAGLWEQVFTGSTEVSNTDIDTGTETVDSFADTLGRMAVWDYSVDKGPGTNMRAGKITATWNETGGSTPVFTEDSTEDIGDTSGVSFTVDKSTNTVRLRCTVGSDNWAVYAVRTLIG